MEFFYVVILKWYLSEEWDFDLSETNKIFEEDIDSKCHKRYEEYEIDISFYGEIFFWF